MSHNGRHMTRRAFVAVCGVSVAAGAYKLIGADDDSYDAHAVALAVGAAFTDRGSARSVGEAYLRARPRERDERRLVGRLRRSNGAWTRVRRPEDVRRLARPQMRRDYEAGRLAAVDGWYLSVTEARLCALATFA
jgi:hypothetical protein